VMNVLVRYEQFKRKDAQPLGSLVANR
jgi:hypothetical protein